MDKTTWFWKKEKRRNTIWNKWSSDMVAWFPAKNKNKKYGGLVWDLHKRSEIRTHKDEITLQSRRSKVAPPSKISAYLTKPLWRDKHVDSLTIIESFCVQVDRNTAQTIGWSPLFSAQTPHPPGRQFVMNPNYEIRDPFSESTMGRMWEFGDISGSRDRNRV